MIIKCPECGHQVSDEQSVNSQSYAMMPEIPEIPKAEEPKKKTGHKILWSSLVMGFVIALIIVFLGIYFYQKSQQEIEMRAYENAMMSTEPAVLQNFLDMYIDASVAHRDSIKAHLEILKKVDRDWQNALASRSKATLQLFMDRNPENIHVTEARLMIDSLDFEAAKLEDTMDAYQKYMDNHQQGAYYDEAANAYDRIREEAEAKRRQAQQDSIMKAQQAAEAQMAQPAAVQSAQPKPTQPVTKPAQPTTKPAQPKPAAQSPQPAKKQ